MESQQVEYKKSFGKEVIISLAAFANTGGKVIVGMDDKGNATGVEVGPETVQRYLNEIKVATRSFCQRSGLTEKMKRTSSFLKSLNTLLSQLPTKTATTNDGITATTC